MYLDEIGQADSISETTLIDEAGNVTTVSKLKPARGLSSDQLILLGARARNRRTELKLTRSEIALKIGIKASTLSVWEKIISRTISQEKIKAWESALGVPRGWLLDSEMEIPASEPIVINTGDSLTAAEEIRKVGCWISKKRGNKTTIVSQLTETETRTANIFALRYGVAGEDASILKAVGDVYGLTRERIRQIVDKAIENLHQIKINTPVIDSLLSNIMEHLPASVADLDRMFREQLGESLSIESLDRFCREILGKGSFQLTERPSGLALAWEKVVINPATHNEAKLRAIRDVAIDMIRSCGGAQVNWVAGTASWQCGEVVTAQDIMQACRMIAGFNWLVESDGWFWFGESTPSDNRVLNLSKKMLAVAGRRLDAGDIQQGLSRARRYNYDPNRPRPVMIEPPFTVVKAILSQVPWVKVIQYNDFLADPIILVEDVLSDSELEIFNLMQSKGGVMSRYEINQSKSDVFSEIMVAMNLDISPVFYKLDDGVFALRGRQLNIASIQHAMESVRGASVKPVEILIDGSISFQLTLTEYQMRNKFIEVPARIVPHVEDGAYAVDGFNTPARSSIKYHRLYHVVQKMIKMGYRAGDTMTIQIVPGEKKIRILEGTE